MYQPPLLFGFNVPIKGLGLIVSEQAGPTRARLCV